MTHNRSRSTARAIAIAKADESRARIASMIRLSAIALFAIAAIAALPVVWSF